MTDASWGIPYVHATGLEDEETILEAEVNNLDATFTVYLGNRRTEYQPEIFFQACWTNGFDTPCSICNGVFDLAVSAPVRLLSLEQDAHEIDPLTRILPPLTITNYHFNCLKSAHIRYFPISHAWHQSIAEAYALRIFNPGAAQACYEIPIRTLLAVIRRFGPDVYLWHDYISIPQWQDEFRGTTILPQIFEIFKESGCAIIHLGLQPPIEVMQLPTLDTLVEHTASLRRFFGAHLFSRLWPVVEFDRAGEAYIMSSRYEIMADTFSAFVKRILDIAGASSNNRQSPETSVLEWIHDLPLFLRERQENKCLGYVFDMISGQGCRSFRDKFIGAAELLEVPEYATMLPIDPQAACFWLSARRLESNDFSPLLLCPSNESKHERARWLKGHTSMTANMWGFGVQTQSAHVAPRLQEHAIYLELELVGTVTNTISWDLERDGASAGVLEALSYLIKVADGSVANFIQSLERIPPSQLFGIENTSDGYQFSALQYQVASSVIIGKILGNLLERYNEAVNADNVAELNTSCNAIISLLALSTSTPTPNLASFANVSCSQLHRQLCDASERTLIFLSCPSCHRRSVFRVNLWQRPITQAQLYLVPGLGYQYSICSGTGIIVENEEIIGRVRFGASACNCNPSVTVKLS